MVYITVSYSFSLNVGTPDIGDFAKETNFVEIIILI